MITSGCLCWVGVQQNSPLLLPWHFVQRRYPPYPDTHAHLMRGTRFRVWQTAHDCMTYSKYLKLVTKNYQYYYYHCSSVKAIKLRLLEEGGGGRRAPVISPAMRYCISANIPSIKQAQCQSCLFNKPRK